jgi:hypothetical protein
MLQIIVMKETTKEGTEETATATDTVKVTEIENGTKTATEKGTEATEEKEIPKPNLHKGTNETKIPYETLSHLLHPHVQASFPKHNRILLLKISIDNPKPRINLDPDAPDYPENGEAMDGVEDDDSAMMAMMGMSGFGTTKVKLVFVRHGRY